MLQIPLAAPPSRENERPRGLQPRGNIRGTSCADMHPFKLYTVLLLSSSTTPARAQDALEALAAAQTKATQLYSSASDKVVEVYGAAKEQYAGLVEQYPSVSLDLYSREEMVMIGCAALPLLSLALTLVWMGLKKLFCCCCPSKKSAKVAAAALPNGKNLSLIHI